MSFPIQIIGQGLAGTCLAWSLWERGVAFELIDREDGGSSRVAAGLINPVTGKRFEPSWRVGEYFPEAVAFYQAIEQRVGQPFWFPLTVVRLTKDAKERAKVEAKLSDPAVRPWWIGEVAPPPGGWSGAFELRGGRLDVPGLIRASRDFFAERGNYRQGTVEPAVPSTGTRVWCEGAAGLLAGRPGPHRCAKGEILTVRAIGWSEPRMVIGGGGWLVPVGGDLYKVGATYDWDPLDETPTAEGRGKVEAILGRLRPGAAFEVVAHEAGIRPILRRSQPLIGPWKGEWFFNGLGSKGSLYAPGIAARLAGWMIDGLEPDPELQLAAFLESQSPEASL